MRQQSMASVVMVVVVGAVIMPLTVRAEAAGQSTRATTPSSGATMQGAIIAVNFDKSRLQLREADGRIVTVPIDPAAKITREGRASSLQDLAVGQTISVQQANRNGKSVATNIEVLPGNSAAGSSTAPAASQHAAPNPGLQSVPPMPSSTSGSMSGSEATGQKQPDAAPQ